MLRFLRSIWNEPAVPDPPPPGRADWALVAVIVPVALIEAALRDLPWKGGYLVSVLLVAFALPWRRVVPLAVVARGLGSGGLLEVGGWVVGIEKGDGLYSGAFLLILPFSLIRWGSGRDEIVGLPIMLSFVWVSMWIGNSDLGESIAGTVFLLFPAALGGWARYAATARHRMMEQVRSSEREQLARELHDTVAHHVSAISIQAQAGRTVAATDPDAATQALDSIEEASSRTLAEMRAMVGILRKGESAARSPQPRVADIHQFADSSGAAPEVTVELAGDLEDLRPSVAAATYRIAQESITNARRHARHASRVEVSVTGSEESIRLTVEDDGDPMPPLGEGASGFGLAGMAERAKLLGGSFSAGPRPSRGWRVEAALPRNGEAE